MRGGAGFANHGAGQDRGGAQPLKGDSGIGWQTGGAGWSIMAQASERPGITARPALCQPAGSLFACELRNGLADDSVRRRMVAQLTNNTAPLHAYGMMAYVLPCLQENFSFLGLPNLRFFSILKRAVQERGKAWQN